MSREGQPRGAVDRFNAKSGRLITFFTNLKTLVVAAIAVLAFGVGLTTEGGRAMIKRVYCQMGGFGVECAEFVPVHDRYDPAMSVAREAVRADTGLDADYTEFSVQVLTDTEQRLRWERDGQRRTYHLVNRDGVWIYNLVSAD